MLGGSVTIWPEPDRSFKEADEETQEQHQLVSSSSDRNQQEWSGNL